MKKSVTRKVLAGILAITFVAGLCVLPGSAVTQAAPCANHNWRDGVCANCGVMGIADSADLEDFLNVENGAEAALLQDISVADQHILLTDAHILDLNGYMLQAKSLIVLNKSAVVDCSAAHTGTVKVARNGLSIFGDNAGTLPVWDGENERYIFTTVTYQKMIQVAADGASARYIFIPNFTNTKAISLLANGGEDNGIRIRTKMTWNNGTSEQFYTFSEDLVGKVYSSYKNGVAGQVFMLTIKGIAGIEDAEVSAMVVSDRGGESLCDASAITTVTKYTVTFQDYDGTVLKTESVESGKAATAPAAPTRAGYTFAGWDKAFDKVTGNLTVTATYTKITAPTVVIGSGNGKAGDEVKITFDLLNSPELYAMSLKVSFDDSALTLVAAESGEAMDKFTYTAPSRLKKGSNFMWYANDPEACNGTVLTLTFKVNDNAAAGTYPITMTCDSNNTYDANDQDVNLDFIYGGIVVG